MKESRNKSSQGVHSYLDVSTEHISKQDEDSLKFRVHPNGAYIIGAYPEGWILSVGEYDPDETPKSYSQEFYQILQYAREMKCTLVRLDRDGTKLLNLSKFDR